MSERSRRGELRRIERENTGGIDNHHSRIEFGNGGEDECRDNWGQTSDVRYTGGAI